MGNTSWLSFVTILTSLRRKAKVFSPRGLFDSVVIPPVPLPFELLAEEGILLRDPFQVQFKGRFQDRTAPAGR
jgi:hypothetical protein